MQIRQAIIQSAVDIAERIRASVILLPDSYVSEETGTVEAIETIRTIEAKTEIPIVVLPKQTSDLIYRIIPNHVEEEEIVLQEHIRKTAVIGYLEGAIKGTIVGVIAAPNFDSIVVYDPRESYVVKSLQKCGELVDTDVFRAIMNLALELATEGREGRHIGTAFIVGDVEHVLERSHQLLLNPFKGHATETRMVTKRINWETFKEFSQLDGVFVISGVGVAYAAGRYLDVNAGSVHLQYGLGGRHAASAAITSETGAVAIVVSASGVIRAYQDGEQMIEIAPREWGTAQS